MAANRVTPKPLSPTFFLRLPVTVRKKRTAFPAQSYREIVLGPGVPREIVSLQGANSDTAPAGSAGGY